MAVNLAIRLLPQPSGNSEPLRPNDVAVIQYLRGGAAVMVVVAHCCEQFDVPASTLLHDLGWGGVDLFFLISGFVMTYSTTFKIYKQGDFLIRRIIRIVPLYWLATLFVAGLTLATPFLFRTSKFDLIQLISSLFFIPYFDKSEGAISPTFHLGWTLNYEMAFYVLFAVFIYMRPIPRTLMIALVFSILFVWQTLFHSSATSLVFYSNPVTLEFVAGCVIGMLYTRNSLAKGSLKVAALMLAGGVALMIALAAIHGGLEDRVLWKGLPLAIILMAALQIERKSPFKNSALHRIGDATYSIYISHIFVVMALRKAWIIVRLPHTGVLTYCFVAVAVVASTFVGLSVFRYVETPMLNCIRRAQTRLRRGSIVTA